MPDELPGLLAVGLHAEPAGPAGLVGGGGRLPARPLHAPPARPLSALRSGEAGVVTEVTVKQDLFLIWV